MSINVIDQHFGVEEIVFTGCQFMEYTVLKKRVHLNYCLF